jgi:hypothetical protein
MLQLRHHERQKVIGTHIGHAVRLAATGTWRGKEGTAVRNNSHLLAP